MVVECRVARVSQFAAICNVSTNIYPTLAYPTLHTHHLQSMYPADAVMPDLTLPALLLMMMGRLVSVYGV